MVQSEDPAVGDLAAFVRRSADLMADEDRRNDAVAEAGPDGVTERLTVSQVADLAARCAPGAPASSLVSIVRVESAFAPLTVRVNGSHPRIYRPADRPEAISLARSLIADGRSVDLGLAQINSRNLARLNLSVEDAFDPCRNLAGAAEILNRGYEQALRVDHADRPILQMAYSIYNTGDTGRGLSNGYVARVEAARRIAVR